MTKTHSFLIIYLWNFICSEEATNSNAQKEECWCKVECCICQRQSFGSWCLDRIISTSWSVYLKLMQAMTMLRMIWAALMMRRKMMRSGTNTSLLWHDPEWWQIREPRNSDIFCPVEVLGMMKNKRNPIFDFIFILKFFFIRYHVRKIKMNMWLLSQVS